MAEWTRQDVRNIAPEFVPLTDATLDLYIALAFPLVNPDAFGSRVNFAGALMTAHLLTVLPPAGAAPIASVPGPVQSRTVGRVSVSYAVQAHKYSAPQAWGMSKYGVQLSQLVRMSALGAQVL